ncbi:hypothetical protein A2985_00800 [Candidatus Woesebacteria bacterium RIFCSPLOWO2_01_FULL_43_11]|nr:MAG: hypothetical protein A2985_00800 [Candidatus Woesebacteria bacterium RIFCSPLOWO2_01_FULL_43_11]
MKRIVILGAGPTGLGAAYQLNELGYRNWSLYEKNDYIGGLSTSFIDAKGFTWDIGGHIIFSKIERFNKLVDELLGDDCLSHQRESWIWLKDTFIRYPFQNNFHFLPRDIVLDCISGLVKNLGHQNSYRNFEEWIHHQFGEGIAKYFMIPYNEKVWATPLKMLGFNWIGDRVSVIDINKIMRSIIYQSNDSDWGPNNTFRYPLYGGTGDLFNRFMPYIKDNLFLKKDVFKVDPQKKVICFNDGEQASYDILISTIPLNELVNSLTEKPEAVTKAAEELLWAGGLIVGIGINKPCPSKKNWMYFPQGDSPFYRVTYLSNYSPNLTPAGDYFSFLAETSYSKFKTVSKDAIIEETIQGLIKSKLLDEEDRKKIVSTYLIDIKYSYPVPFMNRDNVLKLIQTYLRDNAIYSRGRFGGWKYEVGNMDHSVMQGIEVVDKILLGKEEQIYSA